MIREKEKGPKVLKKETAPVVRPRPGRRGQSEERRGEKEEATIEEIQELIVAIKAAKKDEVAQKKAIKSNKKTNKSQKSRSLARSHSGTSVHERLFVSSRLK